MSCDDCVRLWRLSQAVGRRWLMVTILLRDLVGVQQLAQPQVGPHAPTGGWRAVACRWPGAAQPCGQRHDAKELLPEQRASPDVTSAADPRCSLVRKVRDRTDPIATVIVVDLT